MLSEARALAINELPGDDAATRAAKAATSEAQAEALTTHGSPLRHTKSVRRDIKNFMQHSAERIADKARLLEVAFGADVTVQQAFVADPAGAAFQLFKLDKPQTLASVEHYFNDMEQGMIGYWIKGAAAVCFFVLGAASAVGGVCWVSRYLDSSDDRNYLTIITIVCLALVTVGGLLAKCASLLNERVNDLTKQLSNIEKEVLASLLETAEGPAVPSGSAITPPAPAHPAIPVRDLEAEHLQQ